MSTNPRIRVWAAPLLLGLIAAIGLIAALLSDGFGDYLAWVALGIPVAVVVWFVRPRRRQRRESQTSTASELC